MPVILARASQQAAGYRPEGGVERCAYCRFYGSANNCGRILGPVSPRGWCRYFSREIWLRMDGGADNDFAGTSVPPGATVDLNFATMASLDPSVTFTRASTASYFNSAGTMQTAAFNVARFDYDPVAHTARGLLIEQASTNMVPNSDTITGWAGGNVTRTAASGTAPDGSNTMVRVAETATTSTHLDIAPILTIVGATVYTFSIFAKAQQNQYVQLVFDDNGANGVVANFDLLGGTITSGPTALGTGASLAASMLAVGNGVYRCAVTCATNSSTSGRQVVALINSATAARFSSYAGNTANGLLTWGAQFEAGAFPTSYIPTSGAAVARAADVATMPIGAWYNTTVGSLVSENIWSGRNPASVFPRIVQLDNGTNSFTISHLLSGSNGRVYSSDTISGTTGWAMGPNGIYAANTLFKLGTTWQAGAQTFALNAANQTTSAQAALPTGLTTLRFGADASGPPANHAIWLRRVRYWPRVLTNAELLSVTT